MTKPDETGTPSSERKSDFMAAEEIKAILTGREVAEQERIIRWVGESLGLSLHLRHKATHTHPEETGPESAGDVDETSTDLPAAAGRPKDIRSFVQEKQPKSDVQFAAAVAYYHRFIAVSRKDAITTEDLQEGARHSSRAVFKTPSVTLNNAVQQGYLDRGARGEYRLNAVGENLIAMTLPGASDPAKAKSGTRTRAASSGAKRKKRKRSE